MEAGLGPRGALAVMFAWAGLMATIGIAAQRWQVDGRIMLAGFVGVFLVTLGGTILAARGHDRRGEQRLAPAGALQRVAARPSAGVSGDAADQL